jgi:hypothetical protein
MDSSLSLVLSGILDVWITSSSRHNLCHCPQHTDGTPVELLFDLPSSSCEYSILFSEQSIREALTECVKC